MLKEFKEFAIKGNVIDMGIGIIMGMAFNAIVNSLVNDILMPPIGLLLGRVDFTNLFLSLTGEHYSTLAVAQEAGAATINYGVFINAIINFIIVAFVLFLVIRGVNRLRREEAPAALTTKECPYCLSAIALGAKRCPHCTSQL